ncbi:MAG: DUF1080 domain-containing protein [Phycisphaerae bacterium]|jgi:hypothetical protein|nr:DUF1080 domain-containing protein [Phycisphaerae bacterium]MBT5582735.1 DUF1080 domain-containing protein [Phycisphaerae bacterium]MBT5658421.1 DUF1080 domain-containing protein [Phycisphaerae bacterium]
MTLHSTLIAVSVGYATLILSACAPASKPIFNGKDLSGWTIVGGGATYRVEDGDIVGTRGPGPNTFLRTDKAYGDFVLELEFKWDEPINSGVQFRSRQRDRDGRVTGYQCELDHSDRRWTGGIYDEAGRGWLAPLGDMTGDEIVDVNDLLAMAAVPDIHQWSTLRIEAVGDRLQTWVNGIPCADLADSQDAEGFIALQVHGSKDPGQVRWRNIRLRTVRNGASAGSMKQN